MWSRQDKEQLAANDDISSGDFDRQIRGYTRLLALRRNKEDRGLIYRDRAGVYGQKGECDMALADLTEAIRLYPKSARLYCARAHTYLLRGHLDTSDRAKYDASVHRDITYIIDFERRGGTWGEAANRDFDRAIADCDHAIRLEGPDRWYFETRGEAYAAKGDFDRAIADHTEAIRLCLQDTRVIGEEVLASRVEFEKSHCYSKRARAYYDKGEFDRAIADYNEAIRITPRVVWLYHYRGRVYSAKGDIDRAIANCEEEMRVLDGSDYGSKADSLIRRGLLYEQRGDVALARADCETALKLSPGDKRAEECLARLRKAEG